MLVEVIKVTLKSSCLVVPGMLNLWIHGKTWRQEGCGLTSLFGEEGTGEFLQPWPTAQHPEPLGGGPHYKQRGARQTIVSIGS